VQTPSTPPHSVDSLLRIIEVRDAEVALLKLMVDKLKMQLLRRARAQFGSSSEQLGAAQIVLIEGGPLYEQAAPKTLAKVAAANAPDIDRSLPAHLPREPQVHRPETTAAHHDSAGQPCGCTACGGRLRQIGQDVSEQLEYVPSHFKVIRHVRPKLACVRCQTILQAEAASRPIARGIAGPGLIAHVMVSKYCDHTPLYRQSRIYARDGVHIDRSTMVGWVDQGDQLLDPLVAALGRYALAGVKVHADDTPVPVLDPGRGKTKTARLWVYVRDDRPAGSKDAPAVWFQYSPDRKGEHPQDHLKKYSGILQADAYGGWGKLYDSGRVVEAACWAHARRPWWELYLSTGRAEDSVAAQALRRIAALYAVEAEVRGQPPELRRAHRQARAGPLLHELHAWLSSMVGRVSAKSELAAAIGYTLTRWQALTRYRDDGRIEIDNNAAERALRGVAMACS
jgi:transposase